MSAQPVITGGLVNITVVDVLNNNEILSSNDVNIAVALQLAANICGVNVGVLAQQLRTGQATCESTTRGVRISQIA